MTKDKEILEMALIGYQQKAAVIEGRIAEIKSRMSKSAQEVTGIIAKGMLEKAITHASQGKLNYQQADTKRQDLRDFRSGFAGIHVARKRRAVSPEARKRMAIAQTKRWQRYHKAHKAVA